RSGNMRATYKKAGFKVLTDSKYLNGTAYLLPGDILLYDNHHAATNVTAGKHSGYTYRDVIDDLPAYQGDKKPEGLRRGDMGDDVRAMQRALLTWNPDCLPKYGADGDFGGETEAALRAYQKAAGLPETGVYDAATKKALTAIGAPKKVVVTGGNVNVRSAPGTDSRILGVVHAGDTLPYQDVTQTHEGRDWYLVAYEGENGWVSSKYSRIEG
ncbi:MAG: peptidoglycan-binding protein, partial [Oscillospiraceae bacterium]|nr:peptidoglycan-binding protein [Oscillospiraceae bacterium]